MARGADKLAGQFQRQLEPMIFTVEVQALDALLRDAIHRPAPDEAGQHLGQVTRQTECLADLGNRAARAVTGNHRGQCRAIATVGLVDPLDDLLTPLMFKIDVDVGRLAAFA